MGVALRPSRVGERGVEGQSDGQRVRVESGWGRNR